MSIDNILLTGDDALANQWELIIPPFPGVIDNNNTMLRVTSITIPDIAVTEYTIDYKTQKLTKPSGKNATANNFSFTFRIDKYWQIYKGFENWLNLILNQDTGVMVPDVAIGQQSLIRVPIDVIPVDSGGTVTSQGWTFTGCWISSLSGFTLEQASGDALTATVTMQFVKKVPK